MKIVTNGINNAGWLGVVVIVGLVVAVVGYTQREQIMSWGPISTDQGRVALPSERASTTEPADAESTASTTPSGEYVSYSDARLAAVPADAQVVLFFTSPRCELCQVVERDIEANLAVIPETVYIFYIDFDSSLALRREYGARAPLSFVELASGGEVQQSWTGSTSLNSILVRLGS